MPLSLSTFRFVHLFQKCFLHQQQQKKSCWDFFLLRKKYRRTRRKRRTTNLFYINSLIDFCSRRWKTSERNEKKKTVNVFCYEDTKMYVISNTVLASLLIANSEITTVKLVCNDRGYNEFTAITKFFFWIFGPEWLLYYIKRQGYNESRL
jgi:hypothetical protein